MSSIRTVIEALCEIAETMLPVNQYPLCIFYLDPIHPERLFYYMVKQSCSYRLEKLNFIGIEVFRISFISFLIKPIIKLLPLFQSITLREKCPNTELFLVRIFQYSDRK